MSSLPPAPADNERRAALAPTPTEQPRRWDVGSLFDEMQGELVRRFEAGPFGAFPC